MFSRRNYRKFLILSSPRSGTHMLRTSLDAHPNIICLTEMFNPDYTGKDYPFTENTPEQEILECYIFSPQKWRTRAVGFCLHRTDARFGNWPHLWEILRAMPDLLIVSLRRRNLLRRYLSFQLRPTPGRTKPAGPLIIDRTQLVADFEHQTAKTAEFDRWFGNHRLLPITYEDLCASYDTTMRSVQDFLQVPCRNLQPTTEKIPGVSLSQSIQNYAELKQQLADSNWAEFFDE